MNTVEKLAKDLKVGDILVGKDAKKRKLKITGMIGGMKGADYPHLSLRDKDGKKEEHDTNFDPDTATYTVLLPRTHYVIVYLSDSGSVYTKRYNSRKKVDRWLDRNDYKAQVIEVTGNAKIKVEDRT